jgi:hypothetical protein
VHATQLGTSNLTPNYGCGRFGCGFTTDTPENARKLVHEIWDEMNKLKRSSSPSRRSPARSRS